MANKRITDVDFIDSLQSDESFFVNQNNTLKQINKGNVVFEIINGGTGATTAAEALANLGITATAAELNYVDGVTSNIQTQLNAKTPTSHSSTATTYGTGTESNYGHVKLSDSTSSTSAASNGIAASPKAVKSAYDLANAAMPKANFKFTASTGTLDITL